MADRSRFGSSMQVQTQAADTAYRRSQNPHVLPSYCFLFDTYPFIRLPSLTVCYTVFILPPPGILKTKEGYHALFYNNSQYCSVGAVSTVVDYIICKLVSSRCGCIYITGDLDFFEKITG